MSGAKVTPIGAARVARARPRHDLPAYSAQSTRSACEDRAAEPLQSDQEPVDLWPVIARIYMVLAMVGLLAVGAVFWDRV